MGCVKLEFHDSETKMMNTVFNLLVELMRPKQVKAPKKKAESGKWHAYIETPDHKKITNEKRAEQDLINTSS